MNYGAGFRCPVCNSTYFRTLMDGTPKRVGQCKGHVTGYGAYTGCSFTWDRKDDHKVFAKGNGA
jgi:hypothetical protein